VSFPARPYLREREPITVREMRGILFALFVGFAAGIAAAVLVLSFALR
jgi:hypothetical protein